MSIGSNVAVTGVRDLSRQLETIQYEAPRVFETWLPALRDVLEIDKTVFYEVRAEDESHELDYFASSGLTVPKKVFSSALGRLIKDSTGRWGLFDPRRPEPEQRNAVLSMPSLVKYDAPISNSIDAARYGLLDEKNVTLNRAHQALVRTQPFFAEMGVVTDWQLRVLVCEEESLLAWVGAFSEAPPTARQHQILKQLVPALQRRLSLDRLIATAPELRHALTAAMEAIPRPAFIVDHAGSVRHANAAGRSRFDRTPAETQQALREAILSKDKSSHFNVNPIAGAGASNLYLVTAPPESSFPERVLAAARAWSLTRRQIEVLELVVAGHSNKAIAARLRRADRTVELHITALLARAQVASRSALVAELFRRF
jgi:DNA-binding NarL/FixJ family response regulator